MQFKKTFLKICVVSHNKLGFKLTPIQGYLVDDYKVKNLGIYKYEFTNEWCLIDIPTGLSINYGKTRESTLKDFEKNYKKKYLSWIKDDKYKKQLKLIEDLNKPKKKGKLF